MMLSNALDIPSSDVTTTKFWNVQIKTIARKISARKEKNRRGLPNYQCYQSLCQKEKANIANLALQNYIKLSIHRSIKSDRRRYSRDLALANSSIHTHWATPLRLGQKYQISADKRLAPPGRFLRAAPKGAESATCAVLVWEKDSRGEEGKIKRSPGNDL